MKTKTSEKTAHLLDRGRHYGWKALSWWGDHQRLWWMFVAFFTLSWLSYDIGRVTTRAELVRGGGYPQGSISLSGVLEKSEKEKGGRLIITGQNSARFIDLEGKTWEVSRFGDDVSRGGLDKLKQSEIRIDGGLSIKIKPVQIDSEDVLLSIITESLIKIGFIGLYVFILYIIVRHLTQSKGNRFKKIKKESVQGLTIKDIAGYENTKKEIIEFVDYLKSPDRFLRVGAMPPRGILMYGPPGNGKTRMAKAIAGEAHAEFIEQSASSFILTYAGEGAKAVRSLFEEARKKTPCVIFIDEIDAIGAARDKGGHDERIQTLNALLTEMDGFSSNEGIVVIAATNRLEILDKALIRPGRFDRKVHVPMPNQSDRHKMLTLHLQNKPHQIDIQKWSEQTQGFSAADIAGLVNEAAIEAARKNESVVVDADVNTARDRVLMGVKDARFLSPDQYRCIAVHELGHALMRLINGGKIEKISIEPRGMALGVTLSALEENFLPTALQVKQEIQVLMGGRAAEEVILGQVTSGSADDLEKAGKLAHLAVSQFGFGRQLHWEGGKEMNRELIGEVNEWLTEAYEKTSKDILLHQGWIEKWAIVLVQDMEIQGEVLWKDLQKKTNALG